jgi:DNA-directed RNA polymerase specialized sigma24 family protein
MTQAKAPAVDDQVGGILSRPGRSWGPTDRAAVARWLWSDGLEWMIQIIDGRLGEYDYLTLNVLESFLGVGAAGSLADASPTSTDAPRVPYDRLVESYDPSAERANFLAYLSRALHNHAGRAWWRELRRTSPAVVAPESPDYPEGGPVTLRPPVIVSLDGTDRGADGDGPELGGLLSGDLTKDTALPPFVRDPDAFAGMMAVLLEAIDALPTGFREVIRFRYLTDPPLTHRQIAAGLGITENNSRQRLNEALPKLRRILVEMHPAERWLAFASPPDDAGPLARMNSGCC